MSEYSGIRGTRVKYLASDPTLNSSTEGQVWYNSTSGTLKSLVQIKAWSSAGAMSTGRRYIGSAGTQTAGLGFGGYTDTPPGFSNLTEEYSGYTWSNGGNLPAVNNELAGAGTQTAGLAFGGNTSPTPGVNNATNEYDGSAWTAGGNLNTARRSLAGCGTQTAGLAFGGRTPPATLLNSTEKYDGSVWTTSGNLTTARSFLGGAGTQTAGIGFGGYTTTPSALTEEFNGSTWSPGGNLNTARQIAQGAGIQTNALAFSGYTATAVGSTEQYDGTSWVSVTSMNTARYGSAGFGSATAAVCGTGNTGPANTTATEEYNSNINVTPAAVWSSGGNMNTTRRSMAAAGITSSGLAIGGFGPPYIAAVEEYNGTSWSSANNTPVAKENSRAGAGIQTAAFNAGGSGADNGPAYSDSTQEYDGTNWTAGGNMNQQGLSRTSCGTLTAGLGFGGYIGGGFTTATEEYDGTSWTTSGTVPTASYYACAGTQTAALGVRSSSSPLTINYNGSTWTAGTGNLNVLTDIGSAAKNGTEIKTVFFGGNAGPANTGATEEYDGTTFTNTASLTTARGGMAGSGDTDEAFAGGGFTGTNTNVTEEYTYQGASVTTASTLTTS
jgi:hypothetical protein